MEARVASAREIKRGYQAFLAQHPPRFPLLEKSEIKLLAEFAENVWECGEDLMKRLKKEGYSVQAVKDYERELLDGISHSIRVYVGEINLELEEVEQYEVPEYKAWFREKLGT